jgi:hypothetical protein
MNCNTRSKSTRIVFTTSRPTTDREEPGDRSTIKSFINDAKHEIILLENKCMKQ